MKGSLSDNEIEVLKRLGKSLRYFVDERSYSFVDRIANAITSDIAIYAIKDAVRALRSAFDKEKSEKSKTSKEDENKENQEKKSHIWIPSESDLQEVIKIVQKNTILATSVIASIAFGFPPYGTRSKEASDVVEDQNYEGQKEVS